MQLSYIILYSHYKTIFQVQPYLPEDVLSPRRHEKMS